MNDQSVKLVLPTRDGEFKFYALVSSFLVSMLLLSNMMSAAKFISLTWIPGLEWVSLSASAIIYPFVFLGGDVLTEVYGYSRTRRVIWAGFLVFIVSTIMIQLVALFPNAPFWDEQESYDKMFGAVPRILVASFLAYLVGEFSNSFVLAKLKVKMHKMFNEQNGYLAMSIRFVSSTLVGQFFDSIIFFPVAFYGLIPNNELFWLIISSWLFKTTWEFLFVPLTVPVVTWIKKAEGIDFLDEDTDFNPIHLE